MTGTQGEVRLMKEPAAQTSLKLLWMRKELQHHSIQIRPIAMAAGSFAIECCAA
jgi:hypothetical protein